MTSLQNVGPQRNDWDIMEDVDGTQETTEARAFRLSDNFITKLKKDNELQYLQNIEKSKE